MIRSLEETVTAIEQLSKLGWRLGLDRIHAFVDFAGLSDGLGERKPPNYIQVAGTNGKGTATAALQSLLLAQGHRTGGFFSPYVYDFRERIQIAGDLIEENLFCRLASELLELATKFEPSGYGPVTEFEFKTALGIRAFLETRCEWVALEVGLGGRLDATSVVTPKAGIITSIGLDHEQILGSTLAEIAKEKAGILKPNMPLAIGKMEPEAERVIRQNALEMGCEVWALGQEIKLSHAESDHYHLELPTGLEVGPWKCPLIGVKQAENIALAVSAANMAGAITNPQKIVSGIEATRIGGRFEQRDWDGVPVILDGAHNGAAAEALAQSLDEAGHTKVLLVTALLHGHDAERFYKPLEPMIEEAWCVGLKMPRARTAVELAQALAPMSFEAQAESSASEAMHAARKRWKPGQTILVTGSFYLVGEVGNWLSDRSRQ